MYSVVVVVCWAAAPLVGRWLLAPALNGTASVSPTIATSPIGRNFRTACPPCRSVTPLRPVAPGTADGAYERRRRPSSANLPEFDPAVRTSYLPPKVYLGHYSILAWATSGHRWPSRGC